MVISRTPYRISFFGGGTDYPVWYRHEKGAVLATTINKYCYISCRWLPPFFEHRSSASYAKLELVSSNSRFKHPSLRATLRFLGITEGIQIHHDGDLPARTGIGSSSTFTVGLLNALYALKKVTPSKLRLLQESIHIEQEMIRESVGSQDQTMAAWGGFRRVDFYQDRIRASALSVSKTRLQELQGHLMLLFTGFSRNASVIAAHQIAETRNKKATLSMMYQMVQQAGAIVEGSGNLDDFGRLLHESWMLKRSLTDKITNPVIDGFYQKARRDGALGGKLLGAGGGGFMLLFAHPQRQRAVLRALQHLLYVPFQFEDKGSQIIFSQQHDAVSP